MNGIYSSLASAPKLKIEAELKPEQGTRFQPTGFPNRGPGNYRLPNGQENLLVESEQSVGNRMENAIWDDAEDGLVPAAKGMPYVAAEDSSGNRFTDSIHEPHRTNSSYILNSEWGEAFKAKIEKKPGELANLTQHMRTSVYPTLLKYDPNSLLHGAWFPLFAGPIKIARVLSGFIEAANVAIASSGGVKFDRVDPKGEEGGSDTGFGHVPYARDEYTAETITAYFTLHIADLKSYGLNDKANEFLITLALFKIRKFLETGLRLRTSCNFEMKDGMKATAPECYTIPSMTDLETALASCVADLQQDGTFAAGVSVAKYNPEFGKKAKKKDATAEESE